MLCFAKCKNCTCYFTKMIFEMKTLNSRKCDNLACILHQVASKVWHLSSEAEFTVVTMCRINAMKNAMSNCYFVTDRQCCTACRTRSTLQQNSFKNSEETKWCNSKVINAWSAQIYTLLKKYKWKWAWKMHFGKKSFQTWKESLCIRSINFEILFVNFKSFPVLLG